MSDADYLPCHHCGQKAREWTEYNGSTWAVTAPYGVKVAPGQPWTCLVCRKKGKPQVASAPSDQQRQRQRTLIN